MKLKSYIQFKSICGDFIIIRSYIKDPREISVGLQRFGQHYQLNLSDIYATLHVITEKEIFKCTYNIYQNETILLSHEG